MKIILYMLLTLYFALYSCDRIKTKGHKLSNKAKTEVKSRTKYVVDKIFPIFDANQPDTRYNKSRFKEYLGVDLTEDINSIYSFGDFLGADYKVLVAFKCDSSTINRIRKKKGLTLSKEAYDSGLIFSIVLYWWNEQAIDSIKPYKKIELSGDRLYLWYDAKTKSAYYEQYST